MPGVRAAVLALKRVDLHDDGGPALRRPRAEHRGGGAVSKGHRRLGPDGERPMAGVGAVLRAAVQHLRSEELFIDYNESTIIHTHL